MSEESRYNGESVKDIPYGKQCIDDSDIEAVVAALKSDYVTQGPRLQWFEDSLKEVTGARYAVAVSSGTAALHLTCLGLGLGEGDYGVTPAITFAASANCLRYAGAKVAFADVDQTTGRSSPTHFAEAIERSTNQGALKALIPVSFTGAVPDLESIAILAKDSNAYVIEDAAHSIGASYQSADGSMHRSASCDHSDAAILSFHPVKHVCAGEGGAILTNDEALAKRVQRLRSHGIRKGEDWLYNQEELGFNYRMTEMQAALGHSQLGKLKGFIARRSALAERYQAIFAEAPFAGRVRVATSNSKSSWHLFVIHFQSAQERKAAYDYMQSKGIRVQVHYIPVYHHEYYEGTVPNEFSGSETYYSTCLSLPLYPSLNADEQNYVIESLRTFLSA